MCGLNGVVNLTNQFVVDIDDLKSTEECSGVVYEEKVFDNGKF